MRPGCDREVAARLTFDPVGCAVWLDPPVAGDEPVQQVCSIHAATLTVPVGWTVTDRRFDAASSDAAAPRRLPEPVAPSEPVEPPEAVAPVAEAPSEPVEPSVAPPTPVEPAVVERSTPEQPIAERPAGARTGDAPPAVVVRRRRDDRRPSLLDRALRSSGPQHSVLTHQQDASESGDCEAAPDDERAVDPDPGD
jgi:hypothetical protein